MHSTFEARPDSDEMRVLVLPATGADGIAIRRLLDSSGMSSVVLPSVAATCDALAAAAGALVVAEETLAAEYAHLLECIRAQPMWSDLPVILLSSSGRLESPLLAEIVPQLGNVSVVERPVRMSTLVSLIRSSLRARRRQYQVREHLAQQEQAQKIIREAEQRFRLLVENIKDYAIFMVDTVGCVASWNSGAEHMLGYSADEIVGEPAALFFVDEGPGDAFEREMKEARATGRATTTGWRARKNGEHFYVEGVLSAVRDDEGKLLGYAKLMKDVTDKRRIESEREYLLQSERAARSEAERTSRMKDEFLATLGHELRTPLNAILGWSQVLRRLDDGHTAELGDGLKVIERNARAQAQIIEDLLDMSSIISGKVRLDMGRVALGTVLEAAVNAVRPPAENKSITLDLSIEPGSGAVRGDQNRLQQVFWNLLTNAVKFTPKGGRVEIKQTRRNSHFRVSVTDNGEGIDAAFLPYVFERFRQADASASRRHGGLGLGLSLVKQLVELHGGTVSAASEGSGKGSTFTVELPAALEADAAWHNGARRHRLRAMAEPLDVFTPTANLKGVRVLVVDDEPDARSLIERMLQECAATVTTAGSAGEAFERIAHETPDILLSDIGMPKEDGYSLIRRVRSLTGAASRIPAIALTAYARAEDRTKALQAGYQTHLAKPVEPIKLIAMIAKLVRPACRSH
jgi:PAS domain S-box-containing protein